MTTIPVRRLPGLITCVRLLLKALVVIINDMSKNTGKRTLTPELNVQVVLHPLEIIVDTI
jgi:hypothetical protein